MPLWNWIVDVQSVRSGSVPMRQAAAPMSPASTHVAGMPHTLGQQRPPGSTPALSPSRCGNVDVAASRARCVALSPRAVHQQLRFLAPPRGPEVSSRTRTGLQREIGPARQCAPGRSASCRQAAAGQAAAREAAASRVYQQTGTPLGFVAGIPVGRAAVPLKMPHFWLPAMFTTPLQPVVVATSVSAVFPVDGVKFIVPVPVPVPVSALAA